ncbi:sugar transporter [Histoplasma capsulatum var. duboisii H88]|nr:sugar transporter [Histoplasma capsulatum var. duboisii H88]
MASGWFYSPAQIKRYCASRISSLKPPETKLRNPYHIIRELNRQQWLFFSAGFFSWTWAGVDFFVVSLCVTEIAQAFQVNDSDVSWAITVTLMLRPAGAFISGVCADRYGRKWPTIVNLVLFVVLELAGGFAINMRQFLAIRALYGIAMGGIFGSAAATALEDLPYEARGIMSGLFQQGYALGYLISATLYSAFVPTTPHGWRSLFWASAGPPVVLIIFRWYLAETNHFIAMKAEQEAMASAESSTEEFNKGSHSGLRTFFGDGTRAFQENWVLFLYMILITSAFNFCSHGSQDLYPTFLKEQVGTSPAATTTITVVGQIGSIIGGATMGYLSTPYGRRLVMIISCICGGVLVPAYVYTRSNALIISAFLEQFFVGGVWGPIPIHLSELTPPALRGLMVGFTYQLGNMVSSASATIQSVLGEKFPLPDSETGEKRFDYGKVFVIFMAVTWAYMCLGMLLGPEISQEERDDEAQAAMQLYQLQRQGLNPEEVGQVRARLRKAEEGHSQGVKSGEIGKTGYTTTKQVAGSITEKV